MDSKLWREEILFVRRNADGVIVEVQEFSPDSDQVIRLNKDHKNTGGNENE